MLTRRTLPSTDGYDQGQLSIYFFKLPEGGAIPEQNNSYLK